MSRWRAYLNDVSLDCSSPSAILSRGYLDDQSKRIKTTVEETMDDLADFEPRRWFRKVELKEMGKKRRQEWPRSALWMRREPL